MALGSNHVTGTTGAVFRPEVWSKEILRATESNLVLANLVKRYDRDIKAYGQTVEIPNLSNLTANTKTANTAVTLQAPTETKTTINIDQHKETSVLVEDFVDAQSKYDLAREYTQKAGYAISEDIDGFISTEMEDGFSQTRGSAGNAITYQTILDAKLDLDTAKAPLSDRYVVVSPQGHQDLLLVDEFTRYDALGSSGTPSAFKTGKVGQILGMEVFMSQNLPVTEGDPDTNHNFVFHKEAFALAMQKELKIEKQRKTEYLGDLIVASALYGGSVLRNDHGVTVNR